VLLQLSSLRCLWQYFRSISCACMTIYHIFAWHLRSASVIVSPPVYSCFSTLHYMPLLVANDVQRVIARPWVSSVSAKDSPKIVKNHIFWYKCTPVGKFWGSIEKVEYRCTTTNLPLCNDTIIVLKITLLHSVSIITIFVIPKHDKQTKTKTTLFGLQPARNPQSPPYLAW